MTELSLETVCKDLFNKFENDYVANRNNVIDEYFRSKTKDEEIRTNSVDLPTYQGLKKIVKSEVLPIYEKYIEQKENILNKKDNRKWWKYAIGTIVVMEVLELALTKGRSLTPQILFPTLFLEGGLGTAFYKVADLKDSWKLRSAKKKFFKTTKNLDQKLLKDKTYRALLEVDDGTLQEAEAYDILSRYDSSDKFWQDYRKVRSLDPTSEHALKAVEVPEFENFLVMHAANRYSKDKRMKRYDDLFVFAHEFFVKKDENYTLKHLEE